MSTEKRLRRCCPACLSLYISRHKKLDGKYKCKHCKNIFASPATREFASKISMPKHLRNVLEKQKEALAGDRD